MKDYLQETINYLFIQNIQGFYGSVPAEVLEYDKLSNTVKLELKVIREGSKNPPLISTKVLYFGSDDYCIAPSITPGTKGMAMFSTLDIQRYFATGDSQESELKLEPDSCWFIPGVRPDNQSLENLPDEGIQLRNRNGEEYIWLKPGRVHFSVPAYFDKGFEASEKAMLDGESLTKDSHTHPFVNADGMPSETDPANTQGDSHDKSD